MHGSYFHHLFLVCIWLSVKAPQLGCDAVSINGQQDRAAANQCWKKCSLAANVSRSAAKVLESPETCYKECLKKSHLNVSTNSTPISVEQEDNCREFLESKSFLPSTHVKIYLVARGPKFYYANISWNISSDITRNWTQGYLVLYALQINPDTYADIDCHRVLGMNTSFTGFDITNENLTNYSALYVMVFSLSQERGNPDDVDWQSISFQGVTRPSTVRTGATFPEATLPSTVRTEDNCREFLESKSFLPSTHVKLSLVAREPKFYYANISWNISSDITRNWTQGYLVLYALQINPDTYADIDCHRVLGMNTSFTGFDITNENLTNYSALYVMVFSLSQERGNPDDVDWQR